MFEFHKFKITGDQMKVWNIGCSDNILDRPSLIIISDSAVDRVVRTDIRFWLASKQRR